MTAGETRPAIAEGFLRGRQALTSVGATAVSAVARDLGREPNKLLRLMDDGTEVPDGSLSPSAQRVCHYRPKAASSSAQANDEKKAAPKKTVAFGAHTDSTFFTVVPCSSRPGLEIYTGAHGWVCPEEFADPKTDVLVLPGEFIQVLTGGSFQASVHRVLRPDPSLVPENQKPLPETRLSLPLLLRGRDTAELAGEEGEYPPGTTAGDLHRMLLRLFKQDCDDRKRRKASP